MTTDHKASNLDALRDELSVLLRSIEDLEAERNAGDLDEMDYLELNDDYTVRAADLSRRIEDGASESSAATPYNSRFRQVMVIATAFGFAVAAGLLLARFAGERGVNDELTGNIDASTRQRSFECQGLASGNTNGEADILGALECYDEVLTEDPDNLEALSYRGWLLVLTSQSAGQTGNQDQENELVESGLIYLNRAVEIDPTFIDARAFRAATYDRQGRSEQACAEVAALVALDPPEFFVTQTAGIVERNSC